MSRAKRKAAPQTETPGRYHIADGGAPRLGEPGPQPFAGPAAVRVSATDAARGFSDLVNRVAYQGETFLIERAGKAVCQLGPVPNASCTGAELLELLSRLPRPDADFLAAVEESNHDQQPVGDSPWDT
jgi:antitoxin (DNA-binding transcriptional repressor) of toxin-antitoxin stability system